MSQKGPQQFDEWHKEKVTEIQFSKRFPESEHHLLPPQVPHHLVYLRTNKDFSFQYKTEGGVGAVS